MWVWIGTPISTGAQDVWLDAICVETTMKSYQRSDDVPLKSRMRGSGDFDFQLITIYNLIFKTANTHSLMMLFTPLMPNTMPHRVGMFRRGRGRGITFQFPPQLPGRDCVRLASGYCVEEEDREEKWRESCRALAVSLASQV